MEKSVKRTFWGRFFWAPIPFKQHENISGCGSAFLKITMFLTIFEVFFFFPVLFAHF